MNVWIKSNRGGLSWESEEEGPAKQTRSEDQEKGEDNDGGLDGWEERGENER